jgi:hypothetical protein
MKLSAPATSRFQEFQCPDIVELTLSSLDEAFNTQIHHSDEKQSEKHERPASNRISLHLEAHGSSQSQLSEDPISFRSMQVRRSNRLVQGDESTALPRRRGNSSHRISVPHRGPRNLSMVLDLLPWGVGLVWLITLSFGG